MTLHHIYVNRSLLNSAMYQPLVASQSSLILGVEHEETGREASVLLCEHHTEELCVGALEPALK